MAAIDGEKRKERKTRKKNKNRDGTPTKHKSVGEEGCECDQKTTKAASHICKFWIFSGMSKGRIVVCPVHGLGTGWVGEGMI